MALEQARTAQADQYAPNDYKEAGRLLISVHELIDRKEYEQARERILRAKQLAENAAAVAYENRVLGERRTLLEKEKKSIKPTTQKPEQPKAKPKPPPKPPVEKQKTPPPPPLSTTYLVGDDESLWTISAREDVYNDYLLWPLLYKANRDQISDPRTIYSGQVLNIPRNTPEEELKDIRDQARQSDIFPVDLLLKNQSSIQSR